jgi:ectoine hydroxylase-related dioxygenase (phytanoyl-CoA dioxygenase family)
MDLLRFKFIYCLYNLLHPGKLQHNVKWYRKYRLKKYYFSSVSSKDFAHLNANPNWLDQKDSATELPKSDKFNELDPADQNALLNWSTGGYAVLKGFFNGETIAEVNHIIDELIATKKAKWKFNKKIMFAIHSSERIKAIATEKRLMDILELLLGKEVELFQSINFIHAGEQRSHSDAIHMTTFPLGNTIAVWIALEDVTLDNGPFHFYPGSHKLPYSLNNSFGNEGNRLLLGDKEYVDYENYIAGSLSKKKLHKKLFTAEKGDLLIWHANLLHGGEPLEEKTNTRKSMVLHYYVRDVIKYHELTQRPTLINQKG